MKVLHLTPHLGGGVGRALSCLIGHAALTDHGVEHTVVCLEQPQKEQFLRQIRAYGCDVIVSPTSDNLREFIAQTDILQIEWWNHPALFAALCHKPLPPVRLLVWCHISGLHVPRIPPALLSNADYFIFSSPCSMQAEEVRALPISRRGRLGVVSSGAGLNEIPEPVIDNQKSLRAGYCGSLTFAKLHPDFVDYLAAVNLPEFCVRLIGDIANKDVLDAQCRALGKALLDFRGFSENIIQELADINCLVYLLNPEHYGTAENALLEAMAMGVVPIVLDNPAEKCIVENGVTGLIVRTRQEFAEAVRWLAEHPSQRARLGIEAARSVRERFTSARMSMEMSDRYQALLTLKKRPVDFKQILGDRPSAWFLSCQAPDSPFKTDGHVQMLQGKRPVYVMLDPTKGSLFHFRHHFPDDPLLAAWEHSLNRNILI